MHLHKYQFNVTNELKAYIGSVQDLRTGGRWFDPLLGKVIAAGFIPFSLLPIMLGSSQ